jgi:hypothetical protein
MIEPLKYLEAISVIEEVKTDGHSPLIVVGSDYCEYFVKNTRGRNPDFSIINEFLCHYLLRLWDIPTPEIAVVRLLPEKLPGNLSQWHKRHFYETITFGSKRIDYSVELNNFIDVHGKPALKRLINPEVIVKLGLFDIWVENTDRKPTNTNILLVSANENFEVYAIDNAFTFDSLNYKNLFLGITNTYDQSILNTDFAKSVILNCSKQEDWYESLREYFYFCIESSQQSFSEIVDNLPEELRFTLDLQQEIQDFLFNEERNKQVFEEFLTRL